MIIHVIGYCVLAGAVIWVLIYGLRWNKSDETWLHNHGYCRGCYDICEGHMETKAHQRDP